MKREKAFAILAEALDHEADFHDNAGQTEASQECREVAADLRRHAAEGREALREKLASRPDAAIVGSDAWEEIQFLDREIASAEQAAKQAREILP